MLDCYTIQQLKREFGVTARTLRYYEDLQLLKPYRREKARLYTPRDRHTLIYILRARRLHFTLSEIAELLKIRESVAENVQEVQNALDVIDKKRKTLKQMRKDINEVARELEQIEEVCYQQLIEIRVAR